MVAIALVIAVNLLITCVNCYIAWQVWQWRHKFRKMARVLTKVEHRCHGVLSPAAKIIMTGQQGTQTLKQLYGQLNRQLQQLQKLLTVLGWMPLLWRSLRRRKRF
jgi:hypothetical protein